MVLPMLFLMEDDVTSAAADVEAYSGGAQVVVVVTCNLKADQSELGSTAVAGDGRYSLVIRLILTVLVVVVVVQEPVAESQSHRRSIRMSVDVGF